MTSLQKTSTNEAARMTLAEERFRAAARRLSLLLADLQQEPDYDRVDAATRAVMLAGRHLRAERDRRDEAAALPRDLAPLLRVVEDRDRSPFYVVQRPAYELTLAAPNGRHLRAGHAPTDADIATAILKHYLGGEINELDVDAFALHLAADLHRVRVGAEDRIHIRTSRVMEWVQSRQS